MEDVTHAVNLILNVWVCLIHTELLFALLCTGGLYVSPMTPVRLLWNNK